MDIHIREQRLPGIGGPGSPAIGRPANDIRRPSQAGDRVVIAARRQHLPAVVRQLAG